MKKIIPIGLSLLSVIGALTLRRRQPVVVTHTSITEPEPKTLLTLASRKFTSNEQGVATINGISDPFATIIVDLHHSTHANPDGTFSLQYPLEHHHQKNIHISALVEGKTFNVQSARVTATD